MKWYINYEHIVLFFRKIFPWSLIYFLEADIHCYLWYSNLKGWICYISRPQMKYEISLPHNKLDQESWLCRVHLDDLKDNIWTILDHIRSYYTILDHFGPFWIILDHFVTFKTNFDYVRPFWAIVGHFRHF